MAESTPATDKMIRLGIIGAGGIAQVSHIPNLVAQPNVNLAAICDLNQGRAAMVSERHGIARWYDEPELLFQSEQLDGVIISTPTYTHLPLCQLALESGVDVMIEKPFARNASEGRKIVEFALKSQKNLMVGMNHRFRTDTERLKTLMVQRVIGDPLMVRSGWLKHFGVWSRPQWFMNRKMSGGGVLMDLGVQMIDVALYLLDFPTIVEAHAGATNDILGLDVEDTAGAFLRFSDGSTFLLEVSWANCAPKDLAYTHISGSHGMASMNPLELNVRRQDKIINFNPQTQWDNTESYRRSFRKEVAHFCDVVRGKTKPLSTGEQAVKVLEIVDRLYASAGR